MSNFDEHYQTKTVQEKSQPWAIIPQENVAKANILKFTLISFTHCTNIIEDARRVIAAATSCGSFN